MYAQGVSQYGNMTAGSYCYIGPQGIVHGTTLTLMNAGRKYLGAEDLAGRTYVTAGLGGMSGAQAKVPYPTLPYPNPLWFTMFPWLNHTPCFME